MTKPRTQIWYPAFFEVDKTFGSLELNLPKMINQNGVSVVSLMLSFCLYFCKKTNSMLKFVHKPLKKKVISKPIRNFVTASRSIT